MKQKVLVTGASRGIGFAMAKQFAEAGYAVFALWHNAKEQLDGVDGLDITPVHGDVADAASVAAVREAVGAVDILINNAAISRFGLITDLSEADWDEMMAVNLKSVFLLTKAFLPDMIRRRSGKIINVSSIFGAVGGSCEVAYSAAKAGVIGFTKAQKISRRSGTRPSSADWGRPRTWQSSHCSSPRTHSSPAKCFTSAAGICDNVK